MSQGRRLLLTVGIPIALVGSIVYGPYIPGFLHGFFDDWVFPFAITYWLGLGFSNMYFYLVQNLQQERASEGVIAASCGAVALVFLVAGGGLSMIWHDPWMFGVTVMPGVDIAWPAARKWWERNWETPAAPWVASPSLTPEAPALIEPASQPESGPSV